MLPLHHAPRRAAMCPIAVIRLRELSDCNAAKAAGQLRAVSERQSLKTRVPGSGRSRGSAIDPLLPVAVLSANDRCTLELDIRSRRRESRRQRQQSFAAGHHRPAKDPGSTSASEGRVLPLPTRTRRSSCTARVTAASRQVTSLSPRLIIAAILDTAVIEHILVRLGPRAWSHPRPRARPALPYATRRAPDAARPNRRSERSHSRGRCSLARRAGG